jgi:hypothetical protein
VRVLLLATPAATQDLRFKVVSERLVIFASKCRVLVLGEEAITTYITVRFDAAGMSAIQTHDLPSAKQESYH